MTLRTRIAASGLAAAAALSPLAPAAVIVGAVGAVTVAGVVVADEAKAAAGLVRNTCQGPSDGAIRTGNTATTATWDLGCNSARYANYITARLPFKVVNANTGASKSYYGGTVVNISNQNVMAYTL